MGVMPAGARLSEEAALVAHLEALDSLASEDAIQAVETSQIEIYFSKYYYLDLIVDTG